MYLMNWRSLKKESSSKFCNLQAGTLLGQVFSPSFKLWDFSAKIWLLACAAGVEKEGKGGFRRERNAGAREERGRETPARKPLFSPSRLLIMYAKITHLWMTSCQISLAETHLL